MNSELNKSDGKRPRFLEHFSQTFYWVLPIAITLEICEHTIFLQRKNMDITNNIVAPIIVAIVAWLAGQGYSQIKAWRKLREKIEAAPLVFVSELDALIHKGASEGPSQAVVNGRAIVAARDTLRSTLSSISKQLNSEIDQLASDLGQTSQAFDALTDATQAGDSPNAERAFDTIQVLVRIWPAKRKQIEVEIRKLLAELGFDFTSL
jgi:outer membrane murein-binding lipoprotein Lpp